MDSSNIAPDSHIQCFAVSLEVRAPKTEAAIIVPESNWSRLVSRIGSIAGVGPFFYTAAGALAGFMFSAVVAIFTLTRDNPNLPTLIIVSIALFCMYCTLLCLCLSSKGVGKWR